ncbi:hypothetical protein ABEV74_12535 [Paenibacillus cisolokensis]|uniref:hypothetical protein n=1 Tax=Paenibacillus cisolokensis TaxID=1658519 RepID=UPI003D2A47C2
MKYRPIDLQMSVPRTPEMSGIQSHAQAKPAADQAILGQAAAKQTEQQRTRNAAVELAEGLNVKDSRHKEQSGRHRAGSPGAGDGEDDSGRSGDKRQAQHSSHPFKGRHIDISL